MFELFREPKEDYVNYSQMVSNTYVNDRTIVITYYSCCTYVLVLILWKDFLKH